MSVSSSISWADSYSAASKSQKNVYSGTRYRFTSYGEYICSALVCLIAVNHFEGVCQLGTRGEPTVLQMFLSHVFIGLPLYYMHIILGKYTQMGIILLKYLSPIGQGVEMGFTIALFLNMIKNGVLLSHYLVYLLTSMQPELQYLKCPPKSESRCWYALSNCTSNCIDKKIFLSAWLYFKEVFMAGSGEEVMKLDIGIPSPSKVVLVFSAWSVTGLLLITVAKNMKTLCKCTFSLFYITLLLLGILLIRCMLSAQYRALVKLFRTPSSSLLSIKTWSIAISVTIRQMCLGRAFHVIHGSYMNPKWPSALLAISVTLLNFIFILLCSLVSQCAMQMISEATHLHGKQDHRTFSRGMELLFSVLPQALGLIEAPQLWCVVYFMSGVLICLNNQLIHIVTIDKTLQDSFPVLIRYKKYLISVTCLTGFMVGLLLSAKEAQYLIRNLTTRIIQKTEVFNTLTLSILAGWIYGVQKFCDDIHFMYGSQPTKFWKFSWYFVPFFLSISHIYTVYILPSKRDKIFQYVSYWFFIIPVPFFVILAVFRFMKQKNLVGLFQPHEMFGPPDPEERMQRRIYNPRKEIRSRRRNEICHHNCILGNKVLRKVVNDEINYKQDIVDEDTTK